jgi:peptidyl-prolyl cis-trans isomerase C
VLRRLMREPLVWFLLAGAALFFVSERFSGADGARIVVTAAERARLTDQWQAQMGRPPTDAELAALVEQWVREEIYYREALAMGLDDDDVIIRRRLAQKLTFLTEDLAAGGEPDEATLRAYYERHAARYAEPERFSFSHAYFSTERRQAAQADAEAALRELTQGRGSSPDTPPTGDPFMLQRSYVDRSQREIAELFGREFAAAITELEPGPWQGPIRSAYGWHLVRLESRRAPRQPSLAEVANRVAADLQQERRRDASEAFYRSLRERYQVVEP